MKFAPFAVTRLARWNWWIRFWDYLDFSSRTKKGTSIEDWRKRNKAVLDITPCEFRNAPGATVSSMVGFAGVGTPLYFIEQELAPQLPAKIQVIHQASGLQS